MRKKKNDNNNNNWKYRSIIDDIMKNKIRKLITPLNLSSTHTMDRFLEHSQAHGRERAGVEVF